MINLVILEPTCFSEQDGRQGSGTSGLCWLFRNWGSESAGGHRRPAQVGRVQHPGGLHFPKGLAEEREEPEFILVLFGGVQGAGAAGWEKCLPDGRLRKQLIIIY